MKKRFSILKEASITSDEADDLGINLKVKRRLYVGSSSCQKIKVVEAFYFGRVLVLDGIFQTSEKDEFAYHEMLCHLPMFYHPNPQKVLIIGGGDGGALKEVLKHKIKKVWLVEIDKKVIEVSKKYLPLLSAGAFNDPRAEIVIGDGQEFIKNYNNFFDVVILDLTDPFGPARDLISLKFYRNVKKALNKKRGVVSIQSGSFLSQFKTLSLIYRRLKEVPFFTKVHRGCVPLYGAGEYSFTLAANFNLDKLNQVALKRRFSRLSLKTKYYSPEIHFASGVLPPIYRLKGAGCEPEPALEAKK
jgi:spermidine synthase